MPEVDLGGEQRLLLRAAGVVVEIAAEGRDARVQLPPGHEGAVAAQLGRLRHRRQVSGLVAIAEHEFACLEHGTVTGRTLGTAAFDRGVADAVLVAEAGTPAGQLVEVLPMDDLKTAKLRVGLARTFEDDRQ
ncbi:hypothetical protein BOG92_042720 [Streptomyces sp. WAC00263]|nr:hypothetical protein BOG92_042720 [Streptomyces sp. WAC00263]